MYLCDAEADEASPETDYARMSALFTKITIGGADDAAVFGSHRVDLRQKCGPHINMNEAE